MDCVCVVSVCVRAWEKETVCRFEVRRGISETPKLSSGTDSLSPAARRITSSLPTILEEPCDVILRGYPPVTLLFCLSLNINCSNVPFTSPYISHPASLTPP